MLLQIDGWFGSGKSVLLTLLDGHPDVFCIPVHDYSYAAFLNQNNELDWIKTRHTEILRKILSKTQYFKFEKMYWDGFHNVEFSSNERLRLPYKTNFYNFDYNFINELLLKDNWNIETIVETLYTSIYRETVKEKVIFHLPKWFATSSNPLFIDDYINIPILLPNAKSVQVRRRVENIIATRSNRKPRTEDFKTKTFFSDAFEKRISDGEVEKILNYYDKYDDLVKTFPDVFMVVDFLDLVNHTEKSIKKVADFLNIEFHPSLLIASYNSKELECNGKKYIGQENDNIDDLLTVLERAIISERIEKYYAEKIVSS